MRVHVRLCVRGCSFECPRHRALLRARLRQRGHALRALQLQAQAPAALRHRRGARGDRSSQGACAACSRRQRGRVGGVRVEGRHVELALVLVERHLGARRTRRERGDAARDARGRSDVPGVRVRRNRERLGRCIGVCAVRGRCLRSHKRSVNISTCKRKGHTISSSSLDSCANAPLSSRTTCGGA